MTTPAPIIHAAVAHTLHLGPSDSDRAELRCIGYWRSHPDPTHPDASGQHGDYAQHLLEIIADPSKDRQALFPEDLAPYGGSREAHRQAALQREQAKAVAWASLPWPGEHLDPDMPFGERERIAALLDAAPVVAGYCGASWDRVDPSEPLNGSLERSAGGYVWPSGLSTYVRKYGLVLDPEFLAAIGAQP